MLPGVVPVLGSTEAEAKELDQELDQLINPARAVSTLSTLLGVDLSEHPLDAPLPPLPPVTAINGAKSRFELVRDLLRRARIRADAASTHRPASAADAGTRSSPAHPSRSPHHIELWLAQEGAADGFNVMPPILP